MEKAIGTIGIVSACGLINNLFPILLRVHIGVHAESMRGSCGVHVLLKMLMYQSTFRFLCCTWLPLPR